MGKQEIKIEINKALDEIPEDVLSQILELLKQFQNKDSYDISLIKNLNKVLSEDYELLKKLSQ